jgi:hypothetical protein
MSEQRDVFTHLGYALLTVHAAYGRLPTHPGWKPMYVGDLERAVNAALKSGDENRALTAIDRWRNQHLSRALEAALESGEEQRVFAAIDWWRDWDDLSRALESGDQERVFDAIERWRDHHLSRAREVGR